ncbi:MAG: hypothetical protein IBX44_10145 [Sulfurospirillum sp.]|nr:hypothetical protein [Sulfurospirillum sp.]
MTEVIDISKKSRIISVLSVAIPLVLAVMFGAETKEYIVLWVLIAIVAFFLSSYLLERGRTVLRVGSILDKDKRFYLYKNNKKIDSLRIRVEEDASDKEILKRFEEFLLKNNLKQYDKIYLMGSNSKDDVDLVRNILIK